MLSNLIFFTNENMKNPSQKYDTFSIISVISEIFTYCPELPNL